MCRILPNNKGNNYGRILHRTFITRVCSILHMTRNTTRDDVTEALLETLAEHSEYQSPTGVTVHDLTKATDASRRTVLDVLKTYSEKGLLIEIGRRGPTANGYRRRTEYFADGVLSPIGSDTPSVEDVISTPLDPDEIPDELAEKLNTNTGSDDR